MQIIREYRRRLPHIQPVDGTFFITFRLAGSLPLEAILRIKDEYESEKKKYYQYEDKAQRKNLLDEINDMYFVKFDELLDKNNNGPQWLLNNEIASIVKYAIHYSDKKDYHLICYTIMSNHVHLIFNFIREDIPLFRILGSLKRYSARKSNITLGKNGAFWQHESYDHLIRNDNELARLIDYTLNNPVKAGLVDDWRQWKNSYIAEGYK